MEKANQIFYLILGIFVLSLCLNAYLEFKKSKAENNTNYYWLSALVLLALSCVFFTIAPNTDYFFLTLANTMSLASWICIAFLFRSWNHPHKKIEHLLILLLIGYAIYFEHLRIQDSFIDRTYLVITTLGSTMAYQAKQIYTLIKNNKSIHLKFIFLIIIFQLSIIVARLLSTINENYPHVSNIYQEDGYNLTLRMVWYSTFLLLFIFIANYNYEQLLISECKITEQLKKKREKLNQKTKENKVIRQLLEERETLINSLIKANKTATTGALSASIAHELSQPICAIKLNSDFLKTQISSNNLDYASLEQTINTINNDNQRAAKIIHTLKGIFQQLKVETTPTDLNTLIESLLPIFLATVKNNNIELELNLNASTRIMLNESEFQQVILNLINNAIEALIDQQLEQKKITIRTVDANNHLCLSIIDNGPGVPKKLEENLFALMNTSKPSGTGLGLWLSKRIVERHYGDISYHHLKPGHVEFLIKLPTT